MQYVLFTDKFGGYNGYMDPGKVGPSGSVLSEDIDTTDGTLKGRVQDTQYSSPYDTTVAADSKTIVPWSNGALGMPLRLAVQRYGGRLYRSHKGTSSFPASLNCIQYTSSAEPSTVAEPTWDCLGLSPPIAAPTASASTSSGTLGIGTYTYFVTFYNAIGHESAPSPSVTASLSGTGKIDLASVPKRYGTITFTANQSTATITSGHEYQFRAGMRIVCPTANVIDGGRYITSINYSTRAITLSSAAGSVGGLQDVYDAQLTGRKIYRQASDAVIAEYIGSIADMTTTSFSDTGYEAGSSIDTVGKGIPLSPRDIAISPSGIMTCVDGYGNIAYFSLLSPGLYDASANVKPPSTPLASIYALNRFIFPTQEGAFSVSIEDPTGFPVVGIIDNDEPCLSSDFVYCLNVGGVVWWNTEKGIVSTDGNSILNITRYVFNSQDNEGLKYCFGAINVNDDVYIYSTNCIFSYKKETGWSRWSLNGAPSLSPSNTYGSIGFHRGNGGVIYTGGGNYVWRIAFGSYAKSTARYRTGSWSGEHSSNLKKFRKLSVVYSGSGSAQLRAYVDGQAVGSPLSITATSTTQRSSFWLPSGIKGREVQVDIYLSTGSGAGDNVSIQELGVWVGEQREAMP